MARSSVPYGTLNEGAFYTFHTHWGCSQANSKCEKHTHWVCHLLSCGDVAFDVRCHCSEGVRSLVMNNVSTLPSPHSAFGLVCCSLPPPRRARDLQFQLDLIQKAHQKLKAPHLGRVTKQRKGLRSIEQNFRRIKPPWLSSMVLDEPTRFCCKKLGTTYSNGY